MTCWVYIPRRNGDHHRWASVTASRASVQNAPVYHHCFEPDSDRILIGKWRAGRRPLDGSHVPALISDFSTSPVSAANDSFVNTQPVHCGLNALIPCRYYSTATSTFSTTTIKRVLCNFPLSAKQTKKDFSLGSFLELGRCAGANYREKQAWQTGVLFLAFQLGVHSWKRPRGTLAHSHVHQVSRLVSQPWPLNHSTCMVPYHAKPVATPRKINKQTKVQIYKPYHK